VPARPADGRGRGAVRRIHLRQLDQHRNLKADLERHGQNIDKPIAGLLTDLKRRGLLKDTLVVWCGEFGRTTRGRMAATTTAMGSPPGWPAER